MNTEKVKNIHKILVGVDDSPDSQLAFRVAMKRAKDLNATLYITSILERDDLSVYEVLNPDVIRNKINILKKHIENYRQIALRAGVKKVEMVITEGDTAGEAIIKEVIPNVNPDLLIIGALTKEGIGKYFGSQAAYMAKYAPISVLVVR